MSASHASQQAIIGEARTLAKNFPTAEQYLKFMEKVVDKGHDYVEKEHKRSANLCNNFPSPLTRAASDYLWIDHDLIVGCNSLSSILEKKTLMPVKLDELQIKANVLRAFFDEPKAEEEVKVAREEAEL